MIVLRTIRKGRSSFMPKFIVNITVTKKERWEIEAEDVAEAIGLYGEGKLISCSEEDCDITSVEEDFI